MRFIDEMSQPEIAEELGISQSYVSRILRSSLAQLRAEMDESEGSAAADAAEPDLVADTADTDPGAAPA